MRSRGTLLKRWTGSLVKRGRAFGRDENGVTLLEFGILAMPFFAIIGAILETAMIFLAGQILDSAVQDSARVIRTGQAQAAEWDGDDFRALMCQRLVGIFDCTAGPTSRLRISVDVIDNFTQSVIGYPIETDEDCGEDGCDWLLSNDYVPGAGGDTVLVQAFYKWPTLLNLPGLNFGTLEDGSHLLGAARVFRNEPFGCSDCF